AADIDHLHAAKSVHGGAGDRSEISDRSIQPRTYFRRRGGWRASAALHCCPLSAQPLTAGRFPLAVDSLDYSLLQLAAGRTAGDRHHQYPEGGGGIAYAGWDPWQLRGQRRRLRQNQRAPAAPDTWRASG